MDGKIPNQQSKQQPVQPQMKPGQKEEPTEIKIVLPTNAYFMSGIRDFTLAMIRNMTDFSEQWAFRFQSVVDELCNNAIEHGSSPDDSIEIRFVNHPGEAIEIVVVDHGTGSKPMTAEQVKQKMAKNSELDITELGLRGRGLTKIVKEWTDELDIQDNKFGGITVRVKKYLHDEKFKQVLPDSDPTHIVLDV